MDGRLLLEIITPERNVLSGWVTEVQFPTAHRGIYGILPGHTPVVLPLGEGLVSFVRDGERHRATLFGGFAEVGPERVTLLTRESETPDQLNEEALKATERELLTRCKTGSDPEAQADLTRVRIRLQALGH